MSTFLITGGNIGDPAALELARLGQRVRLLVRHKKTNSTLDQAGIVQVEADLSKPETLGKAFEGVDKYLSVTPFVENLVDMGRNAVQAAKAAGVKHFVRSSARGASPEAPIVMGRWHGTVEQLVEDSGMDFTILQPASFHQNFLLNASTIASNDTFYGSAGDGKIPFIDARDIASAAVAVLTQPGHAGQRYQLTGNEPLSNADLAAQLSEVLGRRISFHNVTEEEMKAAMTQQHVPGWMADAFIELDRITRLGYVAEPTADTERLIGRQPITFRQFAQENQTAFAAKAAAAL
ncbi:NAD(P)-dependent oxidoreductase [Hymenobacter amundsenii]|uniref:NAD(P)-dependent oxidoreductase n=1 Tax=Hymenobacter amundsenii TaxID=2006685 RepID=A0A246FG31_9BACT|nr:SDR family oxidoreductase [Hymenobacter amundsenii]OWP61497.1 NAD(P)-dependent oxidoreductase [Hymenobacter amundsenii]